MKQHGRIFSAPMVRAMLKGRKTQTRRIVSSTNTMFSNGSGCYRLGTTHAYVLRLATLVIREVEGQSVLWPINTAGGPLRPVVVPGDLMWVRETWAPTDRMGVRSEAIDPPQIIAYKATKTAIIFHGPPEEERSEADVVNWNFDELKWKSPLFLPRWGSRIVRRYVSVRPERLQDISEADAQAEGLSEITKDGSTWKWGITDRDGLPGTDDTGWPWQDFQRTARAAYERAWDQINGHRTGARWADNPWVWREEFSVENVG